MLFRLCVLSTFTFPGEISLKVFKYKETIQCKLEIYSIVFITVDVLQYILYCRWSCLRHLA